VLSLIDNRSICYLMTAIVLPNTIHEKRIP
jgi:hypothetical protein